ncbi:rhamnulokinase [Pontiellaceae bacterium B12227]|nr:rhamnulokinase [Pontiellaceae bacterium B12227]
MKKHYLAVDLGASSGRVIVGTLEDGQLSLEQMNRFWNGPNEINGTLYWDFIHLLRNIKEGISLAQQKYGDSISSMGVDTWGVDFGLIDDDGQLIGNPVNYRDSRTEGMFEKVFSRVPKEKVYEKTGIQFMELNTLYQLMALSESDSAQYKMAAKLLFTPDLLGYCLTGNMAAERTIASTSQFYNPETHDWAYDLLEELGIRSDLFADLVDPGTQLGEYKGIPVVSVCGHDTACAYAAVPTLPGEKSAFMSSGTWSLLGAELAEPVISEASLAADFTNEVGLGRTIRFLKNMCGSWILQELKRCWNEQGCNYAWPEMDALNEAAKPLQYFIDPSAEEFYTPGDMPTRIQDYCEKTGQGRPEDHGAIMRCYYESMALLYADAFQGLEKVSGTQLDALRIVGGGSQNFALDQYVANAIGRPVIIGPIEATAIGNLTTQMLAMGDIESHDEGRAIIRESFANESQTFEPQDTAVWQEALATWRKICKPA